MKKILKLKLVKMSFMFGVVSSFLIQPCYDNDVTTPYIEETKVCEVSDGLSDNMQELISVASQAQIRFLESKQVSSEIPRKKIKKKKKPKYLKVDVPISNDLKTYIYEQSGKNLDFYCLILGIIQQESSFKSDCVSYDGHDIGYMQVRDCNYEMLSRECGVTNLYNPEQNIKAGIHIIKGYVNKYNNYRVSLMAYNFGEGGARRLWKQNIYTSDYAESVISYYTKFKTECGA